MPKEGIKNYVFKVFELLFRVKLLLKAFPIVVVKVPLLLTSMKEFCQTSDVDLGLTCLGLGNDQECQECPNNTENVVCRTRKGHEEVILHVLNTFTPIKNLDKSVI